MTLHAPHLPDAPLHDGGPPAPPKALQRGIGTRGLPDKLRHLRAFGRLWLLGAQIPVVWLVVAGVSINALLLSLWEGTMLGLVLLGGCWWIGQTFWADWWQLRTLMAAGADWLYALRRYWAARTASERAWGASLHAPAAPAKPTTIHRADQATTPAPRFARQEGVDPETGAVWATARIVAETPAPRRLWGLLPAREHPTVTLLPLPPRPRYYGTCAQLIVAGLATGQPWAVNRRPDGVAYQEYKDADAWLVERGVCVAGGAGTGRRLAPRFAVLAPHPATLHDAVCRQLDALPEGGE
jgi:hypothetical protein